MLRNKDIRERLKDIEEFMLQEYKDSKEKKKRDWRTYEQQYARRIKGAVRNLGPLVDEAVSTIKMDKGPGRLHKLSLKQRVILLLVKGLLEKGNRPIANMLDLFSLLSGIDISYKGVERLYSDPEVKIALHNLHILILKKMGVKNVDATGDGTGYSITVSRHYATAAQKEKDEAKKDGAEPDEKQEETGADQSKDAKKVDNVKRGKHMFTTHTVNEAVLEFRKRGITFAPEELKKFDEDKPRIPVKDMRGRRYFIEKDGSQIDAYATRKGFVYSFRMMDIRTQMYVAFGTSLKSEKEAFEKAEAMLKQLDVTLESVRLDKYYSCSVYVSRFGDATRVYILPKKNATLEGSWKWKKTMINFVKDTLKYLEEYYKRELSEAGFSADKRMFGWGIAQRRPDRIDCAQTCTALWHNLIRLYLE